MREGNGHTKWWLHSWLRLAQQKHMSNSVRKSQYRWVLAKIFSSQFGFFTTVAHMFCLLFNPPPCPEEYMWQACDRQTNFLSSAPFIVKYHIWFSSYVDLNRLTRRLKINPLFLLPNPSAQCDCCQSNLCSNWVTKSLSLLMDVQQFYKNAYVTTAA